MEKYNQSPELKVNPAQVLVTVFDEQTVGKSNSIAAELRTAGINTICHPEVSKLPKQFKFADRNGIRFCVVIGPDEVANGTVVLKDLKSSTQLVIAEDDLVRHLVVNMH